MYCTRPHTFSSHRHCDSLPEHSLPWKGRSGCCRLLQFFLPLALLSANPDIVNSKNICQLEIYTNVMIPYFHILLQKWFATYFELAVFVQLCIISLFRSRLVIGWFQNLSQNFVWVDLVRVTTDTTCLLSFFKGGFLPNVFKALAHRPDEFRAFFMYYDALMLKEGNLTKAEKEMIVVATSAANNCTYCVIAHGALLRIYSKNPLLGDQVNFCLYSYCIGMINSPWTGSQAGQGKKGNWWAKQAKCGVGEKKWWGGCRLCVDADHPWY